MLLLDSAPRFGLRQGDLKMPVHAEKLYIPGVLFYCMIVNYEILA